MKFVSLNSLDKSLHSKMLIGAEVNIEQPFIKFLHLRQNCVMLSKRH